MQPIPTKHFELFFGIYCAETSRSAADHHDTLPFMQGCSISSANDETRHDGPESRAGETAHSSKQQKIRFSLICCSCYIFIFPRQTFLSARRGYREWIILLFSWQPRRGPLSPRCGIAAQAPLVRCITTCQKSTQKLSRISRLQLPRVRNFVVVVIIRQRK